MRTYRDVGITDVPIRPDHVPTMDGEENETPGYMMLGRLWAIGYIKVFNKTPAAYSWWLSA
jgi:mannonate dehydratase